MNEPDRVAIVTGASRGIGRAIAVRLAQDGFAVVVNYASSSTEAEQVVREIADGGGRVAAIKADVSKTEDVARLFAQTQQQFGGIDVLVNNAGIMDLKPIAEASDELFERTFAINVRGTLNSMRAAAGAMRKGGRIINFSSSVLGLSLPTYAVYSASKAAVEALTKIAAKEFRGKSITVNAIAPGPTATDLFLGGKSAEQIGQFAKMAPLEPRHAGRHCECRFLPCGEGRRVDQRPDDTRERRGGVIAGPFYRGPVSSPRGNRAKDSSRERFRRAR